MFEKKTQFIRSFVCKLFFFWHECRFCGRLLHGSGARAEEVRFWRLPKSEVAESLDCYKMAVLTEWVMYAVQDFHL
jgi:hypothetical protein